MPWKQTDPMREKALFVGAAKKRHASFRSLCRAFGITTKTGYKWLKQFEADGVEGLRERSRRPHSNSRSIREDIAERLVELRKEYPTCGPRKLLGILAPQKPTWSLSAASTVGELLKRRGLIEPPREKRRTRGPSATAPFSEAVRPNAVWSMDFKGWFRLGDGSRCDPLTITDNYARFLLCCRAFEGQFSTDVWLALHRVFIDYGLPNAMRVDNQQPWVAPKGELGLTSLSIKLLRLGITLERIAPGKPQQNGRHERFHLTLKRDTIVPPARTLSGQQRRFSKYVRFYNFERPHEALSNATPGAVYAPSQRQYPSKLPEPAYPRYFHVRRVVDRGYVRTPRGTEFFLSTALKSERVGMIEVDEDCFEVHFCSQVLGRFHERHPQLGLIQATKLLPMSPV
jgi:transposase InsO family protein